MSLINQVNYDIIRKCLYFVDPHHFLDFRVEFVKNFRWYFDPNYETKRKF